MSRRRKPAGTAKTQGTSTTRHLAVVPDDARVDADDPIPPAPEGLRREESVARWEGFWRSKLAAYVDPGSDLHRLERWIADVDEFDSLRATYDEAPTVEGSRGQVRLNPIASRLATLEKQIRDAENDFGMTPAARLKLGIDFGGGGGGPRTADDLNAMIASNRKGADDGDEDEAQEGEVDGEVAAGFVEA
jgi:P27 family predicted phage terminase small subunit